MIRETLRTFGGIKKGRITIVSNVEIRVFFLCLRASNRVTYIYIYYYIQSKKNIFKRKKNQLQLIKQNVILRKDYFYFSLELEFSSMYITFADRYVSTQQRPRGYSLIV